MLAICVLRTRATKACKVAVTTWWSGAANRAVRCCIQTAAFQLFIASERVVTTHIDFNVASAHTSQELYRCLLLQFSSILAVTFNMATRLHDGNS